MIVTIRDNPSWLSTRNGGRIARDHIDNMLKQLPSSEKVVFDFTGIEAITSSFADEVFAKLVSEYGLDRFKQLTTFKNANALIATVIKTAIFNRNEDQFLAHMS